MSRDNLSEGRWAPFPEGWDEFYAHAAGHELGAAAASRNAGAVAAAFLVFAKVHLELEMRLVEGEYVFQGVKPGLRSLPAYPWLVTASWPGAAGEVIVDPVCFAFDPARRAWPQVFVAPLDAPQYRTK